jgi:hypothetical protein
MLQAILPAIPPILNGLMTLYMLFQGGKAAKDTYSKWKASGQSGNSVPPGMHRDTIPAGSRLALRSNPQSPLGRMRSATKGNGMGLLFGAMSLAELMGGLGSGNEEEQMPEMAGMDPRMMAMMGRPMGRMRPGMGLGLGLGTGGS